MSSAASSSPRLRARIASAQAWSSLPARSSQVATIGEVDVIAAGEQLPLELERPGGVRFGH